MQTLIVLGLIIMLNSGDAFAAKKAAKAEAADKDAPPPLSYKVTAARKSLINPHEQINDEGEILWSKCLICHKVMPDTQNLKSDVNMKLRFSEDINKNCYSCHLIKKHPGSEGVGPAMSGFVAPSHLAKPPALIYKNMRLIKKELPLLLPLDPATGKIFCGTCHNSHERGLLYGRAEWGADQETRLRAEGADICQYCHRK